MSWHATFARRNDAVTLVRTLLSGVAKEPAEKHLYLPPEDEEYAVGHMSDAELRVMLGVWGRFADRGLNPVDTKSTDDTLKELLPGWDPAEATPRSIAWARCK